jgi:hypothetical protein
MKSDSYADLVAAAMRQATPPMDLRALEAAANYSYEHLRKILSGEPVVSGDCNEAICLALGLDVNRMWELATREKAQRRYPHLTRTILCPEDGRLREAWRDLTSDQKNRLVIIALGMSAENHSMRVAS